MIIIPIENKLKINIFDLKEYLFNSYEKLKFETNKGKFEINGDIIYIIKPIDGEYIYKLENKNKNINFIIKSENIENKIQVYDLPFNFTYENIQIKEYKLHKNSILILNIENDNTFFLPFFNIVCITHIILYN